MSAAATDPAHGSAQLHVLLWTNGRTNQQLTRAFERAGISCLPCSTVSSLIDGLNENAGTAILWGGCLRPEVLDALQRWSEADVGRANFSWLIAPTAKQWRRTALWWPTVTERLRNAVLLGRPLKSAALVSYVRAALRDRDSGRLLSAQAAELERARSETARMAEELRQFAYVTSHDLQEPLRTINSYSQLLSRRYADRLNSEGLEFLDHMVGGSRRISLLIQDLLAYSRVLNSEPAQQPVDLNPVIDWVLLNLRSEMEKAGATLDRVSLPTVIGSQTEFVQLFQALLSNAIKFRRDIPPRIKLGVESRKGEHIVSVADNGQGVEPAYWDRIFGVFKRLHGREIPGSGMGLAVARRIAEKHGGRIWIESQPGIGSTFYVSFKPA